MNLTDQQLNDIETRANAAFKGPWRNDQQQDDTPVVYAPQTTDKGTEYAHVLFDADWGTDADAAFIAAARTDVPALVAEVRRLRKQRTYLIDQLAKKDARSGEADKALREFLSGEPGPTVQPTGYLVSCLPEGHDERWTFTVQVRHMGQGLFAVRHGIRQYGTDGTWSYEPDFGEDDAAEAAWAKEHRFDHDTALRLARELAPTLTYRGVSVADVLAAPAVPVVSSAAEDGDQP